MVIISFADGSDWFKANWVFRQLVYDVSQSYPEDDELINKLEQAQSLGALFPDSLKEGGLGSRILQALKKASEETLRGNETTEDMKNADPGGLQMYREAIAELLAVLNKQTEMNGRLDTRGQISITGHPQSARGGRSDEAAAAAEHALPQPGAARQPHPHDRPVKIRGQISS